MAENQGTKSSIEMFDLDGGGAQEGLSDKVVVINDFEIEQESDLTLQSTAIASDKSKLGPEKTAIDENVALPEDEELKLQRLNITINEDDIAGAADENKFALVQLNLSEYVTEADSQIILRDLPEGVKTIPGAEREDGSVSINANEAGNIVVVIDPNNISALQLQVDIVLPTNEVETTESNSANEDEEDDTTSAGAEDDLILANTDTTQEDTNEAPEVSGTTKFAMNEDGTITINETELLAKATDADGDTLSISNLQSDSGTLLDNNDGTWTFTPNQNFNGTVNLSYDISDSEEVVQAIGKISVAAINDASTVSGPTDFSLNEDGTITLTQSQLLANASDVDGDNLTAINLSADNGTLTDNGDGSWTFTPNSNFNGDVSLSYDVSDGTSLTHATGTIEVAAVNDAATVSGTTKFSMNEDGTITISEADLLAKASDVDGDTLSVENLSSDSGTLADNGDGSWTFTPNADFNGNVSLSYDVSDGTTTTSANGTINVAAVNDAAAVSGPTSFTMNEDGTITISEADLLAKATDVDGDTLSVMNLSSDSGSFSDNGDGTWTFSPGADFDGNVNLSYDVSDGTTTTAATGTIDVQGVNDAAEVSAPTAFTMNEDGTINITEIQLLANASDVDGDTLSVQNLSADNGTLTDNGNGSWTFTPDVNFNGDVSLSYDVSDGTTTTATTGTIDVAAVNDGPTVSGDVNLSMDEDTTITITESQLLAQSSDIDGDNLSVQNVTADDGTLVDNGDGTWSFTPDNDFFGDVNLSFDVSDGTTTAPGKATVAVNDVDEANTSATVSAPTSFSMNEDGTITISEADLLANASDAEGDTLSVVNMSVSNDGTFVDNGNGTWTFTPDENFNGDLDISYGVSDGNSTTNTSGTITVNAVNDAAEVSGPTSFSMNEDGTITISEADLLANASDVEGDNLSVSNLTSDNGTLTDNGNGTWTFEPADDFNGNVNLSYDISDGTDTTAATGDISVAAVNDAAEVSGPTSFTMNEDGTITITQNQLLAKASDVDGDNLSVSNLTADGGTLTDNGNGTWTFEPADDFNGNINLSYDVSDGTTTTPATGDITVNAVNDAADVSGPTSFNMDEDGSIVISEAQLLANASDVDGDTLSVQNLSADGGTLTDNGNGTWTFEPAADFNGNINLSYDVSDGTTTTPATGDITVNAINDAADVSAPTEFVMNEDGSITISETQLLANASDVDGDSLSVQNLSADGGSLSDNGDGTWTFEPAADFNGVVNLSYDVSDGTTTTPATGQIGVTAVNDGPDVSGDVSITMDEDTTITITEAELLAKASDIEGDDLSVENLTTDQGTLTDNGDGTWTFDPGADFHGEVNLSYDVSDGTATTAAQADITVNNLPESKENNGWGNGDQNAPGKSGNHNNAENGNGNSNGNGRGNGHDHGNGNNQADFVDAEAVEEAVTDSFVSGDDAIDEAFGHKSYVTNEGGDGSDNVGSSWKAVFTGGRQEFDGGAGDDVVGDSFWNMGDDVMKGGDGSDVVSGASGDDIMYGDDGDNLNADSEASNNGDGNDVMSGGRGDDQIYGEGGNDNLSGDSGDDLISGGSGDDVISGGDDEDTLHGGSGDDQLDGGDDDDILVGGDGEDTLLGGSGDDTMVGGDGDDVFYGGAGDDVMDGGAGDDIFHFGEGSGSDAVQGGDGWMDTVYLENEDGTVVNEDDWTIELDSGSITDQADGYIELSSDAEGTITFSDGSELTFDGIEKFEW